MKTHKQRGFTTLEMLLVLVLIGIVGYVGYNVYNARKNVDDLNNSSASTQVAVKVTPKKPATVIVAKPVVSAALQENTAAAIKSGNTAALAGYMASSVNVVIAGSEKTGAETAVLAIKDLDYLNSGTAPWDFDLSAATLKTYQDGFYGKYFTADSTIVGQSKNGYAVAFGVNSAGKIDTVFMAASTDQLQ